MFGYIYFLSEGGVDFDNKVIIKFNIKIKIKFKVYV